MNDIVERLRGNYSSPMALEAAAEIERLRAERDLARVEVCNRAVRMKVIPSRVLSCPKAYAKERGWDCYKEATDGK